MSQFDRDGDGAIDIEVMAMIRDSRQVDRGRDGDIDIAVPISFIHA